MSLSRREFNIETGETTEIQQFACRDSAGNVLVLDVGQPLPEGYEEFTPDGRPTYQQVVADINAAYQADVEGFNRAYALAGLSDGATQETKQATIRAQFIARRTQYISDLAAARTEYEV